MSKIIKRSNATVNYHYFQWNELFWTRDISDNFSLSLKYHNKSNPISLHLKLSKSALRYINNRHTWRTFWNHSPWKVMKHFSMCISDCTHLSPLDESLFSFSFNSFLTASDLFRKVVCRVSKAIKVNWHNQENVNIVFEWI